MKKVFVLLLLLIPAATLLAKQPPTHEALFLMKRVGAPAVSPDGRWVVTGGGGYSVIDPQTYVYYMQVANR